MNRNILFVDDEQNILNGIRRQLRKTFEVTTALGPEEGLEAVKNGTEYAVIVSDMRMPGMDGGQFLKQAQSICPGSIRMMLTGDSEQQTAIDAVNQGNIFRFLSKPCETEILVANLEAGVRQYELINAEKELLEKTLKGSIQVLIDILALSNPNIFSKAERMKYYVSRCASILALPDAWQFEVAAMLSQIGYITIPTEIMEKHFSGDELTDAERQMLSSHSAEAARILENIPRLECIAQMINIKETVSAEDGSDPVVIGAQMLRVAKDFDLLLSGGNSLCDALDALRRHPEKYNSRVLQAISKVPPPAVKQAVRLVSICELRSDMILAENLFCGSALIVSKGQVVNDIMRQRLMNFAQQDKVDDKVRVYVDEQVR